MTGTTGSVVAPRQVLRGATYASGTWVSTGLGRAKLLAPVVHGMNAEPRAGLEWHAEVELIPPRLAVVPDYLLDAGGVGVLAGGSLAAEYQLGPCDATDLDVPASVRALKGTTREERAPFVAVLLEWAAWLGAPPGVDEVAYAHQALDMAERCVARRPRCAGLFELLEVSR